MTRTFGRHSAALLCAAAGAFSIAVQGQMTINIATQSTAVMTNNGSKPDEGSGPVHDDNDCSDPFTQVHTESMRATLEQAAGYRPGARDYYVQDFNDRRNEYLRAAISPTHRNEWYEGKKIKPEDRVCFEPLFNQIADAAKKTLPTYAPPAYGAGTPAELKVLRSGVNDLAKAKVFKIGLEGPRWRISKDNYNFPTSRFRYGFIWAKYLTTEDGFCRIIWVNLVQDYAGGGTYGASYANFIKSEPAGCPPGK